MLDIKFIRDNADKVKEAAKIKKISIDIDQLLDVDNKRRKIQLEIELLRTRRNELAARTKTGKPTPEIIEEGKQIKIKISDMEAEYSNIEKEYMELMIKVPTIPKEDTPIGKDDSENVSVYQHGDIPKFNFTPQTHIELAEKLDLIDFERGAKVAGYRGYYLKNEASLLVMALMLYAMNKMAEKGYKPFVPPTLVKEFALFGSGYFKGLEYNPDVDEIYQIASNDKEVDGTSSKEKKFLVGTAEPSLLAYYANETIREEDLPIKVCGFSPCYRSEIGSYGKDTKGLYRVHEFFKVEQVVISKADFVESDKLQEEMVAISKEIHEELGLPYRQLRICSGDLSAGKYKQYDLEAWLPGSNRWAETGSSSNFLDWQARRLNVKYLDKEGKRNFAYLLNNTALPSPRPLIAIMENYQQADGSIVVPDVLQGYMNGIKVIKR